MSRRRHCDDWGRRRWAYRPVVAGDLVTTSVQMAKAGLEEFVEHAF